MSTVCCGVRGAGPLAVGGPLRYLVTGGTGSFGRAFIRRLLDTGEAESVRVFSRDEAKQAQMRAEFGDARLRFLLGCIRDSNRVSDAMRGVDVVVHAAALKRVDDAEVNPLEVIRTNVYGTEHVLRACLERGVKRAVLLSTDKAAAPCTLYGFTKAAAERLWVQGMVYAAGTPTRFAATRYGNVLGSTGSVVPLWRKQAEAGEITLTDPDMTRFWMTMDDAVELVLLALREMRGGEVFVPKIGGAPLVALADALAPGCTRRVLGVRPGEKLHEELIGVDESRHVYDAGTHYLIEPTWAPWEDREPPPYPRVPPRWRYTSDTAHRLSTEALREMAA